MYICLLYTSSINKSVLLGKIFTTCFPLCNECDILKYIYYRFFTNINNTKCVTCRERSANISKAHEIILSLCWDQCCSVVSCLLVFVDLFFFLDMALSVCLRLISLNVPLLSIAFLWYQVTCKFNNCALILYWDILNLSMRIRILCLTCWQSRSQSKWH